MKNLYFENQNTWYDLSGTHFSSYFIFKLTEVKYINMFLGLTKFRIRMHIKVTFLYFVKFGFNLGHKLT